MMKLVLLATLAVVALARIPSNSWEQEHFGSSEYELKEDSFRAEREFIFKYKGQVATGLPGSSSQHSASQVQAKVSLVFQQDQQVIMTVRHIRMGKLNEEIANPRAMIPFMSFQPVEIAKHQEKQLQLPIKFQYKQGIISELEFDGQDKSWSTNIKRGILNLLQVNLAKRNQVDLEEEHILGDYQLQPTRQSQKMDYFTAVEKTIQGECKTHYTIVSEQSQAQQQQQQQQQQENVLNVTRTLNFEECQGQRPEMKYNFRFQDPCQRCEQRLLQDDEKFLRSSSITRYNISGTPSEFVIDSAVLESQYQVVPFNREGSLITTYVNQTLELKYSGPIRSQPRQPSNPQKPEFGLIYDLEWDVEKEQFFMQGQEKEESPMNHQGTSQNLRKLLRPLVNNMVAEVSDEVPIMYLRLVRFISFTPKAQLKELFRQFVHEQPQDFVQEEHQKIKSLLIDALADAGTKDSVSYLLELIKEEKLITPLRASLVLKQLINTPLPSKQMIEEFRQFLKHQTVQHNWILKQSAYLTFGSLVQGVCMPSEEKLAVLPRGSQVYPERHQPNERLCPEQLQQKVLKQLMSEFHEQDSEQDYENQILILKTIGNMGLPRSVKALDQIIKQTKQQQNLLVRIEAVVALRQLREILPKSVIRILMPMFMNSRQPNQLRMAAVYQIFQCMPERPVLDQIARKLFSERSQQVASFVYTYMYTIANTTNPCEKSFGKDLQLALRHGRQISGAFMPQYSKFLHTTYYSQKFLTGLTLSLSSIISNRTFVPQSLVLNLHSRFLGFWSKYLMTVGVAQENVESLFNQFVRRTDFSDVNLEQILSQSPRAQAAAGPMKELKQLWKQLETVARQMPSMTPKGYLFMKLKDQEFFMLPMSQKTLKQLPSLKELKRTFVQGKHFNIQKAAVLHTVYYKIPTSIGMPLRVALWVPAVAQLQGQIRIETQNPFKLFVNNLKPSVAVQVISRVEIWNPFAANGVQIRAKAKLSAPITGKIVVDLKSRMPSIKFSLEPAQKSEELCKLETIPSTYLKRNIVTESQTHHKTQQKTVVGEQFVRQYNVRELQIVREVEQQIQNVLGLKVRAQGLWHRTAFNLPSYIPVCPFNGPNHLVIRSQPASQQPKEFVVKMSLQNIQQTQQNIEGEQIQFPGMQSSDDNDEQKYQSQPIQSAKGYHTMLKTELFTKGADQERRAHIQTQLKCTPFLRVCKYTSQITVQPIPQLNRQQVKLCISSETQLPRPAYKFDDLFDKKAFAQIKATWGQEQCQSENIVEIKMNAEHSEQQQKQYRRNKNTVWWSRSTACPVEDKDCVPSEIEMQPRVSQQQELLKYNLFARYQNLPVQVKNITNKAFQALKAYYYWNTDVMNFNIRNPSNQIRAQFTVDSQYKQLVNVTIKTPIENVTVTDAQLPVPVLYAPHLRQPLAIRSFSDLLENLYRPAVQQCVSNGQRVQTFDDVQYRFPMSDCWSLLAKDCQDESNPRYAVLMRNKNNGGQQKQVKIISQQHKILLETDQDQPRRQAPQVKVDGQKQEQSEYKFTQDLQIEQFGQRQVIVSLPQSGVKVFFDGQTAKVEVSPMMQAQQCGACGHYNQEQRDEFYTAQNQRVSDIRQFIKSYTLKDEQCQYPQQLSDIYEDQEDMLLLPSSRRQLKIIQLEDSDEQQEDSQQQQQGSSSEESSSEEFDQQEQQRLDNNNRMIRRPIVQEEGDKLCVSLQTYPKCPRNSYPIEYKQEEQEVELQCIELSHHQAHRLQHIARRQNRIPQELKELLEKSQSQIQTTISIPKQCERSW